MELDESCIGDIGKGRRRGRGVAGKIAVFGILKRGGKLYTRIIGDAKTEKTSMPLITRKIEPVNTI